MRNTGPSRNSRKPRRERGRAAIDAADRAAAERLAGVSVGPVQYPRFTAACTAGVCAKCHGAQFRRTSGADPSTAAVFGLKAAAMTALDTMCNGDWVTCITGGAIYEVG